MDDFSYITPPYLEDLTSGVLWRTVQEYRHASDLLLRNPGPTSQELRSELMHAVEVLEKEMRRRALDSSKVDSTLP